MRTALQRCSAALPRTLSSFTARRLPSHQAWTYESAINQTLHKNRGAIRSLHQSSLRLQEAATQAESIANDGEDVLTRFDELESKNIVHTNVIRALTHDMGLETMTEVQTKTINAALKGTDIIAQAKTGTGKTLAFLLPILQNIISIDPELAQTSQGRRRLKSTADDIRALIISPTRELAEQIADEAKRLVKNTGVIVQTAVGGTHKRSGLNAIQRQGCHILVGTPGRLKDILSDPYSRVEAPDLSALVLDEADRLLDQGFWPEVQEIQRLLPTPAEKDRQTLMFSATVPKAVVGVVRSTLKPGFQFVKCVRDDEEPTHARVPQHVVTVKGLENMLPALVETCHKGIEASKQPGGNPFKAIVYYNSTAEVTLAATVLQNLQGPEGSSPDAFGRRGGRHPWAPTRILEIHARLSQMQRTKAAEAFRKSESAILLSSDVTARGMDFPNVTHVIQVGLPSNREQYIHRIGRTARAGKEGEGWLIMNSMESPEARDRLYKLPLKQNNDLMTASLDLKTEAQVPAAAGAILKMYQDAIQSVTRLDKVNVYRALLGVYSWFPNKRMLVQSMNNLSKFGWGMSEPPAIAPGLAQKLRIDRVEGINIGHDEVRAPPASEGNRGMRGRGSSGAFGSSGDRSFGGPRDRSFGGSRDRGFGGSRDRGFGGSKDRGFGESGNRESNDAFGGRSSARGGFGGSRGGYGGRSRDFGERNSDNSRSSWQSRGRQPKSFDY